MRIRFCASEFSDDLTSPGISQVEVNRKNVFLGKEGYIVAIWTYLGLDVDAPRACARSKKQVSLI